MYETINCKFKKAITNFFKFRDKQLENYDTKLNVSKSLKLFELLI